MVKSNKRKRPEEEKNTSETKRLDSQDEQLDLFDTISTHPKLTKQQKRDAKRSSDNSRISNASDADNGEIAFYCVPLIIPLPQPIF
jgi:hypothetical protein